MSWNSNDGTKAQQESTALSDVFYIQSTGTKAQQEPTALLDLPIPLSLLYAHIPPRPARRQCHHSLTSIQRERRACETWRTKRSEVIEIQRGSTKLSRLNKRSEAAIPHYVLMYNPKLVWVIEVLKVWTRLQVLLAVWTKEELDAIKASQPKLYDDRPSKKKEE
ncbi:Niban-like protein 2 [Striga asiatica]|uniref:Niban-like protein 2 n=1 Tax=Striga asiatica TaxID=4170 RepID=A0A5A7Q9A0_STRAF|nr:Niban-like protein 2 [Striga asiatica]